MLVKSNIPSSLFMLKLAGGSIIVLDCSLLFFVSCLRFFCGNLVFIRVLCALRCASLRFGGVVNVS